MRHSQVLAIGRSVCPKLVVCALTLAVICAGQPASQSGSDPAAEFPRFADSAARDPDPRVPRAEDPSLAAASALTGAADSLAPVAQRRLVSFISERYGVELPDARSFVALASRVGMEVMLDPLLLLAVIAVESRFDPFAQSRRGAEGLMQIRTHVHAERFERFGGRDAAFDPLANIRVGAELLKGLLEREGSTEGALKAYVGAARRPHDSGYGARVLQARAQLAEAAEGAALVTWG
jgi:soluble lytic murein transglycosylase-like protein